MGHQFLTAYLVLVNAAALALMLADKQKAKQNEWRIPEARLMWAAALGGSIGCLLSMYLFRHKTRHLKFTVGIPLLLAAQIALGIVIWIYLH